MAELLTEDILAKLETEHGDLLADPRLGVVLRPLTEATFDRFSDERNSQPQDAAINLCTRQLIWPTLAEFKAMRTRKAMLPSTIVDALCSDAGAPSDEAGAHDDPVNASTPGSVLDSAGLPRAIADELTMKHSQGGAVELALVVHAGAAVVLRAPTPAEFAALQRAHTKGIGFAAACRMTARDCAVWANEPLAELFARLPALASTVLVPVITRLGGAGAEGQFRRRRAPGGRATG